ncbi:MAG: aminotransferase class I/II-fold pyridoxal phosphate-dependent enzyme [Pseudonocardiaceae bacterium]
MDFHDILHRLAASPVALDLSTGSPLVPPELRNVLRAGLRDLADDDQRDVVLSSYAQLDGLDEFREEIAGLMSEQYGRRVCRAEVIAVPGIQAALRYLHRWLTAQGRRALYPIGLEFAGAVDRTSPHHPAVGPYTMVAADDGTWRPVIDVTAIRDWSGVGAVILSRPHSPTGRDWSTGELTALAAEAADCDALLVLDETYAPPFAPITEEDRPPVDAPNVVRLFSMSKLGLAGERVGVVVASAEVVTALSRLQRSFIIQPPKVGQFLTMRLLRAFRAQPSLREMVVSAYRLRWEAGRGAVEEVGVSGLRVAEWEGGLFLWMEWNGAPTDREVADALLAQDIAVMPGTALVVLRESRSASHPQGLRIGLGAPPEAVALAARAAAAFVSAYRQTAWAGSDA